MNFFHGFAWNAEVTQEHLWEGWCFDSFENLENCLFFDFTQLFKSESMFEHVKTLSLWKKVNLDQTVLVLNQIYFRPVEEQGKSLSVFFLFNVENGCKNIIHNRYSKFSLVWFLFFTFALLGKKLHLHAIPIGHSINSSSSSHVKVRFLHSNSTWYVSIRVPLGFIFLLWTSNRITLVKYYLRI